MATKDSKRKGKKGPRRASTPKAPSRPRISQNPDQLLTQKVCFSTDRMDEGGEWGWSHFEGKSLKNFLKKLLNFQNYNITELKGQGSHLVSIRDLILQARRRLEEIPVDTEKLFSLRFSGKERAWCILDRNILALLWWDPKHEVCPSHKKHT